MHTDVSRDANDKKEDGVTVLVNNDVRTLMAYAGGHFGRQ